MTETKLVHGRQRPRLAAALAVYLRPKVAIVVLLGFSAGLPLALSGATLAIWLADAGVDVATIGLLSLAGLPYTLKFLWAPVVDALGVPWLSRRLGHRRGWLLASQMLLATAIALLASCQPSQGAALIGAAALLVAFASATQDVVIDAFRIESLAPEEQAAGMAGYVAAYRIAMLVSGAGLIALTALLEARGLPKAQVWPIAYGLAALLVGVGMLATALAKEPTVPERAGGQAGVGSDALARVLRTARDGLTEFLTRKAALWVLAFVVLFKLCDALAGAMTGPFVLAIGYDKATYAAVVKGLGLVATLAGGFLGGAVARVLSLEAALWLAAGLQMASNLVFTWLALQPVSAGALTAAIVAENLAGGIGTVIFVAYMSALCGRPAHTATQYALLTALAAVGRTLIASLSGVMALRLGWPMFFIATALAAAPSLAVLAWLQARGHFRALEAVPGAPQSSR